MPSSKRFHGWTNRRFLPVGSAFCALSPEIAEGATGWWLFPDGGGVEPAGSGVVGEELQQVFEEAPDRLVLHQVMGQDAGRLVDIPITGAPGLQMLNQNCDGGIDTDKTAQVTPVYRVEMRVYLE